MTSVFLVSDGGTGVSLLGSDLAEVGIGVVGSGQLASMIADVVRGAPDLVILWESHPGDALFSGTDALRSVAPCPVIVFTTDPDAEKIEKAMSSGVHAYVINGYGSHRLRSLIHLAQARFRHEQSLREELSEVRHRFAERKLVDRAKGILMRVRNIGEEEAYRTLRSAAMSAKLRVGQAAQQVIDAARYAEAVNRSGQLRMLSQRLVNLYARLCGGDPPPETARLYREAIEHIEGNLALLDRALSRATFGDLLDAVLEPWTSLRAEIAGPAGVSKLAAVDRAAERLLIQAEALTRTLESAGFAAALRIINVSGRQRMLCQRIAKHAVIAGLLAPEAAAHEAEIARCEKAFADGLDFLQAVPLSTEAIRATLLEAVTTWGAMRDASTRSNSAVAVRHLGALGDDLLRSLDRLTDLYERSIQTLME